MAVLRSLRVKRCTNISAAIGLASQEQLRVSNPNAVRAIFLLTDGPANEGVRDQASLVKFTKLHCSGPQDGAGEDEEASTISDNSWVKQTGFEMAVTDLADTKQDGEAAPKESQMTLHCFGYGSDHNSSMLQTISDATPGGTYYFVEDDKNVLTAVGDALGGVLSVVAQNAVLNISIPQESAALGAQIVQIHHKNTIQRKDGSYSVSLGDFYAEESRDVLFEVKLATHSGAVGTMHLIDHATVSLSFTDTLQMKPASCPAVPCAISRLPGQGLSAPSRHVKVQWLRVRVTEAIAEADKLSKGGDMNAARAVIRGMVEAIELCDDESRSDPLVEQLVVDLNRIQDGLVSVESYNKYGTHRMQNTIMSHGTQRCTDSLGSKNIYRSSAKTATMKKFSNK